VFWIADVFIDALVVEDPVVFARELVDDAVVVDTSDEEEVEELDAVWLRARYAPAAATTIMTTSTAATVDLPIARLNFNQRPSRSFTF
jgi:hypothetical protein